MRRKTLFLTCSLVLLGGCFKPEKPKIEVCQLDGPKLEGICGISGSGANTQLYRKPIDKAEPAGIDKATCFAPTQWKLYKDYIDLAGQYIDYLERNCK